MDDRKRAEALARRLIGSPPSLADVEMTLIAFAEVRDEETERCAAAIRAAGASAGPAEGEGRAARDLGSELEWTGEPRAEGTPLAAAPEPLREALPASVAMPLHADTGAFSACVYDVQGRLLCSVEMGNRDTREAWQGARWIAETLNRAAPSAQPPLAEPSPPTPQASETPLEPKFAHTHAETFADAMREFGHAQASETPSAEVAADLESEEAAHMETIKRWSAQASDLEALRRELAEAKATTKSLIKDVASLEEARDRTSTAIADAEATIATLREALRTLGRCPSCNALLFDPADECMPCAACIPARRAIALSPPQADAQACKCERRSKGYRHNHGNCPVHPAPSRFPDHNGQGGPVWIEEDDATTTQGGEG